jgi:hypothetical protein
MGSRTGSMITATKTKGKPKGGPKLGKDLTSGDVKVPKIKKSIKPPKVRF